MPIDNNQDNFTNDINENIQEIVINKQNEIKLKNDINNENNISNNINENESLKNNYKNKQYMVNDNNYHQIHKSEINLSN